MKYCSSCGSLVARKRPSGDSRDRWVCGACEAIHYQNPNIVVGCVPRQGDRILLCRRAIEPRRGFWTVPAGFLELGETIAEGAARETLEEACAAVRTGHLFASVDVVDAGQVHLFFTGELIGGYGVGEETQEVALFAEDEIPWDEIAFRSGTFALRKYFDDAGKNHGVHLHAVRRNRQAAD
jgi:ADP-ribose pyrophosphatase YjhB (NUDIX family)